MKKHMIVSLAVLFLSTAPSAYAFTWGVCGHAGRNSLWNDPETEFATMEKYGLKTYRFDVALTDDKPHEAEYLEQLLLLAHKHHIILHPVIFVPFTWGDNMTDNGRYPATEAGLETQGYNRVYPFVLRFASQIHDWELENEISLKKSVKKGIGNLASDYDTEKGHQWAATLRGMARAVHDAQKQSSQTLRTVIDFMGVDYGLIDFLEQQGVSIDKLAYHYYYKFETSPYDLRFPNGPTDIFAELRKRGKTVIINEFNAAEIYAPKNEHKPYDDAKALASLQKHIEYITGQKEADIEGIEYYELYNEPDLDVAESNFGLMKDPTHIKTQVLLAATYACGTLSSEEKKTLLASGLFSAVSLAQRLSLCQAR